MRIKPIEPRQTTVELIVERIGSVIKSRNLAAGKRVPEGHELVEQLRLSRPILRESLARCQSLGIVDIPRVRGTFVVCPNSIANRVFLLRSAVAISPQQSPSHSGFRSAIEVQSAGSAEEPNAHEVIAQPTSLLKQFSVLTQIPRMAASKREDKHVQELHESILQAIGERNPNAAANAMLQRMQEVFDGFTPAAKKDLLYRTPAQRARRANA